MSAISQLSGSLGTLSFEQRLALVNLNLDFSLCRVPAPKEFQALGDALSTQRREAAETGTPHRTARKLGALFHQLLPSTPNLIRAYGCRVSEIARITNTDFHVSKDHGVFTDQTGIDGTSIWAAATSGNEAVAVHLLACMLSRLWSPSEATSIWAEIVAERKRELHQASDSLNLTTAAAMQFEFTRDQLAGWDASARALLSSADKAKEKQQKQLMLIIGNVNIPVNNKMKVYESVIQAWTSAMTTADKLIGGEPLRALNGATLLGLSAWHLYPKLVVVGDSVREINFDDPFVSTGGILTIGLQSSSVESEDGVYWSLPLAHLRYYGPPVLSAKSIGSHGSRISFDQLQQVALGCVFRDCGFSTTDICEAAKFIVLLRDYMAKSSRNVKHEKPITPSMLSLTWFGQLATAANALLDSEGSDRELFKKLIERGKRRCPRFLANISPPMNDGFGLCKPIVLLSLLRDQEERISTLRNVVARWKVDTKCSIIGYKDQRGVTTLVTVTPCSQKVLSKSDHRQIGKEDLVHIRWTDGPKRETKTGPKEERVQISSADIQLTNEYLLWKNPPPIYPSISYRHAGARVRQIIYHMKSFNDDVRGWEDQQYYFMNLIAGDSTTAALYGIRERPYGIRDTELPTTEFSIQDVSWTFAANMVDSLALVKYFYEDGGCFRDKESKKLRKSLQALATAAEVYKLLPNATLSLDITSQSQSLHECRWLPTSSLDASTSITPLTLDRPRTFACIASFESGSLQASPEGLGQVMALSTRNSIYVAAALLCDPAENPNDHEIRRVEGNFGRAGIAMLIPPTEPMMREPDNDTWQLVNHADFDGRLENCFESTSLHLSFTEFELPIDIGPRGGRDHEACLIESVVSVHDRGKWVADLDILGALKSRKLRKVPFNPKCHHSGKGKVSPKFSLTSLDSWDEFLDRPTNAGIVRSHQNWLGRLAATALSVQKGYTTIILPDEICWGCVIDHVDRHRPPRDTNSYLDSWVADSIFIC